MTEKETRKYAQIRVKRSTQQTLKRLADSSGLDYIDILEEWAKAVQSTIDNFGAFDKLSVYSHKYEKSTEHEGLVLTRLGKLVMTSFPLEHSTSDKEAVEKAKAKAK